MILNVIRPHLFSTYSTIQGCATKLKTLRAEEEGNKQQIITLTKSVADIEKGLDQLRSMQTRLEKLKHELKKSQEGLENVKKDVADLKVGIGEPGLECAPSA